MIPNIKSKEPEIKEIWVEERAKGVSNRDIFFNQLNDYFDTSRTVREGNADWALFIRWIGKWKKEDIQEMANKMSENITDEASDDLMDQNRKRMIVLLNLMLLEYEKNPLKLKLTDINEINRLYKNIKSADEAIERTKIQKGKLGLDVAKTLLFPYHRMSVEDILKLKESLNASFERILKLKSGSGAGQGSLSSG